MTEAELIALAAELGAADSELHAREASLLRGLPRIPPVMVASTRDAIRSGGDPLGEFFGRIRTPEERRPQGATYTPLPIVREMVAWADSLAEVPVRVVDPGLGSGRFLRAAADAFPDAELVGTDVDPVATLLARANLAAIGADERASIFLEDYRSFKLPPRQGRTLFLGNPPYVRHHELEPRWKDWLASAAALYGLSASKLAGLHVYFYLATRQLAAPGDYGTFITSSEWLDVNYGQVLRDLFLQELGGRSLLVIDPAVRPFPDAATTAVITTFEVGQRPAQVSVRMTDKAEELAPIDCGTPVHRERLETEQRWTHLLRAARSLPSGYVELGEICRVHRGQVTGANGVWIAEAHEREVPSSVLFPSVTRARELFDTDGVLRKSQAKRLRHVIDIPADLDELGENDAAVVRRFLAWARRQGAHKAYTARNRSAWWAVGLREPPPIMATYMARRPPAFVRNDAGARYINIAHGIYPREPMAPTVIRKLHEYLSQAAADARGRIYAGGLMKFEPREMERIAVPGPDTLAAALA